MKEGERGEMKGEVEKEREGERGKRGREGVTGERVGERGREEE